VEPAEYLDVLRDRSNALLVSAHADLDAPVPSCPGWTVAELVAHVGGVWGWAAAVVRTGDRADFPTVTEGLGAAELIAWAEQQAHLALDALGTADPDSSCWTFGEPRSRRFWFRRQALETAVHAWDVQQAVAEPEPIEPELACDGIDEFLTVMLPRQLEQQPAGWTGQSLHLHSTDGKGEWVVNLGADSAVSVEHVHRKGDVALQGTASSLYLWCLNRIPLAELAVFGDRAVAHQWTTEITF
jgi:uncharacterized protein (TIGR03083 family)